jgi:hypothetical protein
MAQSTFIERFERNLRSKWGDPFPLFSPTMKEDLSKITQWEKAEKTRIQQKADAAMTVIGTRIDVLRESSLQRLKTEIARRVEKEKKWLREPTMWNASLDIAKREELSKSVDGIYATYVAVRKRLDKENDADVGRCIKEMEEVERTMEREIEGMKRERSRRIGEVLGPWHAERKKMKGEGVHMVV